MSKKSSLFRVFVGVAVPDDICCALGALQDGLPRDARLVDEADFHVTLTFIGNAAARTLETVDEALSGISSTPFSLTLSGVGCFSGGHGPRHIWAGIADCDALHRLKTKVDRALDAEGVVFDRRKFVPHVTLARVPRWDDDGVGLFLQRHSLFTAASFMVDEFALYRSYLDRPPPRYDVLAQYPFY